MKNHGNQAAISKDKRGLESAPKDKAATQNKIQGLEPIALKEYSEQACKTLNLDAIVWNEHHLKFVQAPQNLLLMYFSYIMHYQFNPLCQDIILVENPSQTWRLIITVDGWAKYMNRHPQFRGIQFQESEEKIDGIPSWIECSIYRHDRIVPITIREYYQEAKADHEAWIQMPRRMLRHKAFSQCARLAFGIAPFEEGNFNTTSVSNSCVSKDIGKNNRGQPKAKSPMRAGINRMELLREKLAQSKHAKNSETTNQSN